MVIIGESINYEDAAQVNKSPALARLAFLSRLLDDISTDFILSQSSTFNCYVGILLIKTKALMKQVGEALVWPLCETSCVQIMNP